jgi:hypothetical protein
VLKPVFHIVTPLQGIPTMVISISEGNWELRSNAAYQKLAIELYAYVTEIGDIHY